jgi:hypothetical protein
MTAWCRRCYCGLALGPLLLAGAALAADDMDMPMPAGGEFAIAGIVRLASGAADAPLESDRLILRIYHPKDNIQHDLTYRIFKGTALPHAFRIGPIVDMNGNPRFWEYVVEAYTDRDGDAGEVGEGEIFATSGDPVPLGTSGLILELATP